MHHVASEHSIYSLCVRACVCWTAYGVWRMAYGARCTVYGDAVAFLPAMTFLTKARVFNQLSSLNDCDESTTKAMLTGGVDTCAHSRPARVVVVVVVAVVTPAVVASEQCPHVFWHPSSTTGFEPHAACRTPVHPMASIGHRVQRASLPG